MMLQKNSSIAKQKTFFYNNKSSVAEPFHSLPLNIETLKMPEDVLELPKECEHCLMGNGEHNFYREAAFWRSVAAGLLGMLLAGFSSWLMFDRDQPSRAEVRQMVDEQLGPVVYQVKSAADATEKLNGHVQELTREVDRVLGELGGLAKAHKP